MTAPRRKSRAVEVAARLARLHPDATCSLDHRDPFELLVATVLSAQCTDARVNLVTPILFRACPDAAALDRAPLEKIEGLVKSTGFYRNKAKALKGLARRLVADFGGRVPADFEALTGLPGVARKTANVVLGSGFGVPSGVVVDTHVGRLSRRLGLTKEEDPVKVERDLAAALPSSEWIAFSHRMIAHGRAVCTALRPRCDLCALADVCPSAGSPRASAAPRRSARPGRRVS